MHGLQAQPKSAPSKYAVKATKPPQCSLLTQLSWTCCRIADRVFPGPWSTPHVDRAYRSCCPITAPQAPLLPGPSPAGQPSANVPGEPSGARPPCRGPAQRRSRAARRKGRPGANRAILLASLWAGGVPCAPRVSTARQYKAAVTYSASQSLFTQAVWKRMAYACSDFTTCHASQYSALDPFTISRKISTARRRSTSVLSLGTKTIRNQGPRRPRKFLL